MRKHILNNVEGRRQSIGILLFLYILNLVTGDSYIDRCSVSNVEPGLMGSMTINAIYKGTHLGTTIKLRNNDVRPHMENLDLCQSVTFPLELDIINCTAYQSNTVLEIFYPDSSERRMNFIVSDLSLNQNDYLPVGAIELLAYDGTEWISRTDCSDFVVPSYEVITGTMQMSNPYSYEKSDITITVAPAKISANASNHAIYKFIFPRGALTASTTLWELNQLEAGITSTRTSNTYSLATDREVDQSTQLSFKFTEVFNPPVTDYVIITIQSATDSWLSGNIEWPVNISMSHSSMIQGNYSQRGSANFDFSFDFTAYPLQMNDTIKIDFNNRFTINSMPNCAVPFKYLTHYSNPPSVICELNNASFTSGMLSIGQSIENPSDEGIYHLTMNVNISYANQLDGTLNTDTSLGGNQIPIYISLNEFFDNSSIQINGTSEIEKANQYLFDLQFSRALSAQTKIIITLQQGFFKTSAVCNSNPGTCTFQRNEIIINDAYPNGTNYAFINTFGISGLFNPDFTYDFSEIKFKIVAVDGNTSVIGQEMGLNETGKYSPHHFETVEVFGDSSSTMSITNYNLNFMTGEFIIRGSKYYKLKITLPPGMKFSSVPNVTAISGITPSFTFVASNTYIVMDGAFATDLYANSNITLKLSNIQNKYATASNLLFEVYIYKEVPTDPYFKDQGEFSVDIDTITEFNSAIITSNSTVVALNATYNIMFQLQEWGNIDNGDFIMLRVPDSIAYCDAKSIQVLQHDCFPDPLDDVSKHNYSKSLYGYKSNLCPNFGGQVIEFEIGCINPETTQPAQFILQAQGFENNDSSIYYQQSISGPRMTTTSTLPKVEVVKLNNWLNYPNKFTFMLEKSSPYNTTFIDQITISFSAVSIASTSSCPTISDIEGIIPQAGGLSTTCTTQTLTIGSIIKLEQVFKFTADSIQNPSLITEAIEFIVQLGHSEGYEGQKGTTTEEYITCDYPCRLCTSRITTNCNHCYPENHSVFEGGPSKYKLVESGTNSFTCTLNCSEGTYQSSDSCSPCNETCKRCQFTATNCTKCNSGRFLLDNICEMNCPDDYSNNNDDNTCVRIKGFHDIGTAISLDNLFIETVADYNFILQPEIVLMTNAKLEITSPPSMEVETSCQTNVGSCTITDSIITIEGFLTHEYVHGQSSPINLQIKDTYRNPSLSYSFSEMLFIIETKVNATVYHRGEFPISEDGRYIPYTLGGTNILTCDTHSTVSLAKLTFNFTNGYQIPSGHKIIINFPNSMRFSSAAEDAPIYNPLEGVTGGSITNNYPDMEILDGFPSNVAAGSNIRFDLHNIITPYQIQEISNFEIYITTLDGTKDETQFSLKTTNHIFITDIAQITSWSIIPNNTRTSQVARYEFSIDSVVAPIYKGHYVIFQVPPTIQDCDYQSIIGLEGFSSQITTSSNISASEYSFSLPCNITARTRIKFGVDCRNPGSTKSTENFYFHMERNSGETYYESTGKSVNMTEPGTFSYINMTMEDQRPTYNNSFTITVNMGRSERYKSSNINQMEISVPESMNITECSFLTKSGIYYAGTTLNLTIVGQTITIGEFDELSNEFQFVLKYIKNPPNSTNDIIFGVLTKHSEGDIMGEKSNTNILHTTCDFPCVTCTLSLPKSCDTCFLDYLYKNDSNDCLMECPDNYYESGNSFCEPCDSQCLKCGPTGNNCTECHPNEFLYQLSAQEYRCESNCPSDYSNNVDDWTCVKILNYESGTEILLDNREVEKPATYKFYLLPEEGLRCTDTKLVIDATSLGVGTECHTTIIDAICLVENSRIILQNFLALDYTHGVSDPIQFEIYDSYRNPDLSYEISSVLIRVTTQVNETIYHQAMIPITAPTDERFNTHTLTAAALISNSVLTTSLATLTFNLTNTDYPILAGRKIILGFPHEFCFNCTTVAPIYTPLENLEGNSAISLHNQYITVENGFQEPSLPANSNIRFHLGNILTPYGRQTINSMRIYIAQNITTESQFTLTTGLSFDITEIASLTEFSVIPESYVTSWGSQKKYIFSVKLGYGEINSQHQVTTTVPEAVKSCNLSTLTATFGFDSPITNKSEIVNARSFIFHVPCTVTASTVIKFEIKCYNPETTKPTNNFRLHISLISNNNIFYIVEGSPLIMTELNTFEEVLMNASDYRPLVNATYQIGVRRRPDYISTHINYVQITVPGNMNISSVAYSGENGIIAASPITITTSGQMITLGVIDGLEQYFNFKLINISNPPYSADNIVFKVLTSHKDGYLGEQLASNTLHTLCDFPCKTCKNAAPTRCLTCFAQNDLVFASGTPQAYLYMSLTKECLVTCPAGFSKNVEDSTCFEIKSFEEGSYIHVIDNLTVDESAVYSFYLKPQLQVYLKPMAKIFITSPPQITINSVCSINKGKCSIRGPKTIIVENIPIVEVSVQDMQHLLIQFSIDGSTYNNPNATYLLKDMLFKIETKLDEIIFHSGTIEGSGISGTTRYRPHYLHGATLLTSNSSATASLSTLTFNLSNTDHQVPSGHKIIISFPGSFGVLENPAPFVTPFGSLDRWTTVNFDFPYMTITGWFPQTLSVDSNIIFSIHNILTPYEIGIPGSFVIDIADHNDGTVHVRQFTANTELTINITERAEFPAWMVTPASYKTCARTQYEFTLTLGDRGLTTDHFINFIVPPTISDCNNTSLIATEGIICTINPNSTSSPQEYLFPLACSVPARTTIKFEITCTNPETTRTTGNFTVSAKTLATNFYFSTGNPVTMKTLNNFSKIYIEIENIRPLVKSTYVILIKKTLLPSTSELNQIEIQIPNTMNASECKVNMITPNLAGITLSKNGQALTLSGFTELPNIIKFELLDLHNPKLSTDQIILRVRTQHSDGTLGEEANSDIMHIECDFPCETCLTPNSCQSCFTPDHYVFGGEFPQPVLYSLDTHSCYSQCPLGYYEHAPTACYSCLAPCKDCHLLDTNCTLCFPGRLLSEFQCVSMDQCPQYYYPNQDSMLCEKCHEDCVKCTGKTSHECKVCIPDMEYNPSTDSCCPNGHFSLNHTCYQCDPSCVECYGPTNSDCLANQCNTDKSYYSFTYLTDKQEEKTICIFECNYTTPLYVDQNEGKCGLCHDNCAFCHNSTELDCYECKYPYLLTNNGECTRTNNCTGVSGTFEGEGQCVKCAPTCADCKGSADFCLRCKSPYLFIPQLNSCVLACPPYYYQNIQLLHCQKCPDKCINCGQRIDTSIEPRSLSTADIVCTVCVEGYYLKATKECVAETQCGFNSYSDVKSKTCRRCNLACKECSGSTRKDCIECRTGYYMTQEGECQIMKCQASNQFINAHNVCQKCDKDCKSCSGGTAKDCRECEPPLFAVSESNNKISCMKCSEMEGLKYREDEEGCEEICGDGINLGMVECDDGNREDGDGCDHNCRVEDGYICSGGRINAPDICKNMKSPQLFLLYVHPIQNILYFEFTENVLIKGSKTLDKLLSVSVTGDLFAYDFKFDVEFDFVDNEAKIFKKFKITIQPLSDILDDDIATITLNGTTIFDIEDNLLNGPKQFKAKLHKFNFITPEEEESVRGMGNTIQWSIMGTLSINLLLAILVSSSLSLLIPLFNLIQLISFIPLLEIRLPENLRMFISDYLMFSHFQFPFSQNPLHSWGITDMSDVMNKPYSDNFAAQNIHSKSFAVNYGGQLFIWGTFIAVYIFIRILYIIWKNERLHKMKQAFEYGIFNTLLVEGYIDSSLFAILNLYNMNSTTKAELVSTTIGFAGILMTFLYPVLVLHTISRRTYKLTSEVNLRRYGSLYSETQYNRTESLCHLYIIFFLTRRLLYVAIIIFLKYSCTAQQILNISIHFLMCLWNYKNKPFGNSKIGMLIYSFDYFAFGLFAFLPFFFVKMPQRYKSACGFVYIAAISLVVFVSWIIIIMANVRVILVKILEIRKNRELKKKEKEEMRIIEERIELEKAEKIRQKELEEANRPPPVKLKKYRKYTPHEVMRLNLGLPVIPEEQDVPGAVINNNM